MRLAFCLLLAAALSGCGLFFGPGPELASDIRASDDGALQSGVRIAKILGHYEGAPSTPQTGHAIELGVAYGHGSATQSLPTGFIFFGNTRFNGPVQLTHDFPLYYYDATYRFRYFPKALDRRFGFEGLAGLGWANLDLTVQSPTQRASESLSHLGLQLAGGLVWRLLTDLSLQGRYAYFNSGDDNSVSIANRFDASLMYAPARNIGVRAGYRWWTLKSNRDNKTFSPIKIDLSGPSLGLELMF